MRARRRILHAPDHPLRGFSLLSPALGRPHFGFTGPWLDFVSLVVYASADVRALSPRAAHVLAHQQCGTQRAIRRGSAARVVGAAPRRSVFPPCLMCMCRGVLGRICGCAASQGALPVSSANVRRQAPGARRSHVHDVVGDAVASPWGACYIHAHGPSTACRP